MQLASIHTFADCEEFVRETKSWRGKPNEWPLHPQRRREQGTDLLRLGPDTYAARLFKTNIVTYHRDGTVELRLWNSAKTIEAYHSLAPATAQARMLRGRMYVSLSFSPGDHIVVSSDVRYRMTPFGYVETGTLEPIDGEMLDRRAWLKVKIPSEVSAALRREFATQITAYKATQVLCAADEPRVFRYNEPVIAAMAEAARLLHEPTGGAVLATTAFMHMGSRPVDINLVLQYIAVTRGLAHWVEADTTTWPPEPQPIKAFLGQVQRMMIKEAPHAQAV